MIHIVLIAHGQFASGIKTSLDLIAGEQEHIQAIDFIADMSAEEVKTRLLDAIEGQEQTLILCDLLGGTPFKVASTIMMETSQEISVLSGLNLAMLLDATFSRLTYSLDELTEKVISSGRSGIINARTLFSNDDTEDTIDDGI